MSEPVNNPPYEPPPSEADLPPPVPIDDPNLSQDAKDLIEASELPPDPRDPTDSELIPGELTPPTTPMDDLPPVNVDVPAVSQDGAALNCTMGNWSGVPDTYVYGWLRDGVAVGDGTNPHPLVEADVGAVFTCVVTATNAIGATAAPPSNEVTVVGWTV